MISRERVLTALRCDLPDRVPYCEFGIDRILAQKIMGWAGVHNQTADLEANTYTIEEIKALARTLNMDNIYYVLRAPVYAEKRAGRDGRLFYGEGLIKSRADVDRIVLPDPFDDALYEEATRFADQKEEFACVFATRVGIFPTLLSMGLENFSIALYEDPELVEMILDLYVDWAQAVAEKVSGLGFDIYLSTDDMAFKTAPYFSPAVFHDLVLPRYRRIADAVQLPWVIHTDGNILPFIDDLLSLGIAGLHPIEKGAMDIREMKRRFGDRLCLLGNIDLNLLGNDTPLAVEQEVKGLIQDLSPGGGYIVTSGNSLAGYLIPENVRTLARTVKSQQI